MTSERATQTALVNYLEWYCGLTDPRFAVLVTGDWGTGKTFQVKKALKDQHRLYVSLNGVDSAQRLQAEVFAAAAPDAARREALFEKAGKAATAMGGPLGALGGFGAKVAASLAKQAIGPERILVFDDLERCQMPLETMLGEINDWVEHRKFRVVAIVNEDRLGDRDEFRVRSEKLFGQRLRVEPDIEAAFTSFLEELPSDEDRDFLSELRDLATSVFSLSREGSLRILRHCLFDLSRLRAALNPRHLGKSSALRQLCEEVAAWSIAVRAGWVSRNDLLNRPNSYLLAAFQMGREVAGDAAMFEKFLLFEKRFEELSVSHRLLSEHLLVRMLCDGLFDRDELSQELDDSPVFKEPSDLPLWRRFYEILALEDKEAEELVAALREEFDTRSVADPGELFHIFAVRLRLAELGELAGGLEQGESECETYLEELQVDPSWFRLMPNLRTGGVFWEASHGWSYGFPEAGEPHFNRLTKRFWERVESAFEATLPDATAETLRRMREEPETLAELIATRNGTPGPFAAVAFLHLITPDDFVDAWVSAPRDRWQSIPRALKSRYRGDVGYAALDGETDWLRQVATRMIAKADELGGMKGDRVRRLLRFSEIEAAAAD